MSIESKSPALIAAFEDRYAAEQAIDDLLRAGFTKEDVGFVIRGEDAVHGGMLSDATGAKDGKGAITGAITGATVGGLTAAVVTALIPGVGPILAAGTLAMMVGYAGAGAAIGGIFGALTGLGVSEHEAKYYEQAFNEGKALVAVRAATRTAAAAEILTRRGGHNIQTRTDNPIQIGGALSEP